MNLVRSSLKLDTLPSHESVFQYHAHLVSEAEFASRRLPKAQVHQAEAELPPGAKGGGGAAPTPGGDSPDKRAYKPCKWYTHGQGCRRGDACSFEHKWSNIPAEERADRCRRCGGKGHRKAECPYGARPEAPASSPAAKSGAGGKPQRPQQAPVPQCLQV